MGVILPCGHPHFLRAIHLPERAGAGLHGACREIQVAEPGGQTPVCGKIETPSGLGMIPLVYLLGQGVSVNAETRGRALQVAPVSAEHFSDETTFKMLHSFGKQDSLLDHLPAKSFNSLLQPGLGWIAGICHSALLFWFQAATTFMYCSLKRSFNFRGTQ
jgi:hypothetical protein